ncbi:MAG TPA: crossover junction endodeoxyribonuclease RuvC [Myxococcota bacterium]|nr:crossover junction endodeoxyribonuclease RuvC [Myxococcota bacterium]
MRILGIDPGSSCTGYGLVERGAGRAGARGVAHLAHGTLRPPRGASLPVRLAALQRAFAELLESLRPDVAVVERAFVAASPRAALVLGHARGVALAALGGAGVPVHELAPAEIKLAIAGSGVAEKRHVQAMVQRLLALPAAPSRDAADALAAALCHAQAGRLVALGARRSRAGATLWRSAPHRADASRAPSADAADALRTLGGRSARFVLRRR